jgi:AraC-like DNA-binding protein
MKHAHFHIRLCGFDKMDVLGEIGTPVSVPISSGYSCDELARLALSEDAADVFKMETELRRAICDILASTGKSFTTCEYSREIKNIIGYIRKNLSLSLNIPDIAREFGFSQSTLTRRFRREIGMSIGEYIDKLIMFEAERALVSTSASVLEISESFGFCDQFYFSRRFREKYGVSPREYRKKTNI